MRVGILGETGFVGSNLQLWLNKHNIDYKGVSRKTGLDATDTQKLTTWIVKHDISHLVNLAADCGGIGLNQRKPADLWAASTRLSASVLEAARLTDTRLIQVGTVCSYAKNCPVPFTENDLMRHGEPEPTNLAYGLAKLNGLYGAQAYHKQYGLRVHCLIPVNMYGPRDHFDPAVSHVVPALIHKIWKAKQAKATKIDLWGTGSATREFLYVFDFCEAIRLAILHGPFEPTFINIGSGRETPIKELATTIAKIMEFDGELVWDVTKPDGQPRRCLNVDRANKILEFTANTSLEDGLLATINWYREAASTEGSLWYEG